ncbi:MAG TPA: Ni/Fe hydrogenase subunit alpha [Thermoleophilaceae bacterium]|jgi:sulfhydrogenase subunit alpha|nr:Ni/Fe hydrogenase subunit alpha [Thermoleophilaceae bacterium]
MSAEPTGTRTIKTPVLARVEGEGAMHVRIRGDTVERIELRIFEPPRFFEALLRGRRHSEPPDITARICGICPVAYQMSACAAIEAACGVVVDERVRLLRRLIYCGEWIESHTLHVFLLHAPDFLGYESAVSLAADHRDLVEQGLAIKKAGNELIRAIGGREVHPINVRVGGFWRAPGRRELRRLVDRLERARELALATVRWAATLDFPELEEDYEFVALSDPDRYPLEGGRLVSSRGLDIAPAEFEEHFVEEQVPHSTALHSRLRERGSYLVGPMARWALNAERLSPLAREAAAEAGLEPDCRNPFRSILVRSVEILYALDEALRLIEGYEAPDPPAAAVPARAGTGEGWTEAPRGLLWHRYTLDEQGTILDARIVPPTSQNQTRIEEDLHEVVRRNLDLADEPLRLRCEQTIRNYDPCISCATHFLSLTVDRG